MVSDMVLRQPLARAKPVRPMRTVRTWVGAVALTGVTVLLGISGSGSFPLA